jgi:hypothetical protein
MASFPKKSYKWDIYCTYNKQLLKNGLKTTFQIFMNYQMHFVGNIFFLWYL